MLFEYSHQSYSFLFAFKQGSFTTSLLQHLIEGKEWLANSTSRHFYTTLPRATDITGIWSESQGTTSNS